MYLAREHGIAGMERLVVIKRILPHLAEIQDFVDMFLREGRIIARLNHPNIVQIYELGSTPDKQYFLALEYIPGVTLRELQVLASKHDLEFPEEVVLEIGMQTAAGLEAAHKLEDLDTGHPLGLVHRDVTPHNLMCMSSGLVKLLDFGIAKATQGGSEATFSGDLKGKFSYMSPEQALQKPLDARSDIFSLGIVLWESLTGRRLFKRDSQLEMLQAISKGDVPSPALWRKDLHPKTVEAIMKSLAKEPADRYQSASEFHQALKQAAEAKSHYTLADATSSLVDQIAKKRLSEQSRAINAAKAKKSLSPSQRHRLLHETSSASYAGLDEEAATIVDRPEPTNPSFGARPYTPPETDTDALLPDMEEAPTVIPPGTTEKPSKIKPIAITFAVLALAAITAFVAFQDKLTHKTYSRPAVTLGWAPIVNPDVLRKEMEPLHTYLSDTLDREVKFEVSDSYEQLANQLRSGEIEFAMLPPLLYVQTSEKDPRIKALAVKEFDGAMTSDGLLLTRSGIKPGDLEAIKGKKFCLTDRNSTTGNFLPRAYLRDQGVDPNEWMGEIIWSGDHLQLLKDLGDGVCDVGATHSGAFISADKQGISVSKLRTFAITGQVPQDVLCASPDVPVQESQEIMKALTDLKPKEAFGQNYLGNTQRITGFVPASEDMYQQLRKAFKTEVATK